MNTRQIVCGVVLAGGMSRRMGGQDKSLMRLSGKTLIERVIETARPQVASLSVNTNLDPEAYRFLGLPILSDSVSGHLGPLVGVLTGMDWARANHPDCDWLVTLPCDAPFIPSNLVSRFQEEIRVNEANLACAESGDRLHPVIGLWSVSLYKSLKKAIIEDGIRKVDQWTATHRLVSVEWAAKPFDPFFNINSPQDLEFAEKVIADR